MNHSEMVHPGQKIYFCFVEKCIVTFRNISSLEAHLTEHAAQKKVSKELVPPSMDGFLQEYHFKCQYENCGRTTERKAWLMMFYFVGIISKFLAFSVKIAIYTECTNHSILTF
jgi:hypothetical protein